MIAEEAYWSIAFGALMLVDFVLLLRRGASPRAVRVVAAVAAGALMCVMGWAYFTSYGNPAWAAWQTLPLFVLGDLVMGSALWALMREGAYRSDAFAAAFAVLGALAVASIALIAAHFAGLGYGALPFAAAVVLVVAGRGFRLACLEGQAVRRGCPRARFRLPVRRRGRSPLCVLCRERFVGRRRPERGWFPFRPLYEAFSIGRIGTTSEKR